MELDQALDSWLKDIQKATMLSLTEKSNITNAGAKVYEKALKRNTPRSDNRHEKTPHLQDSIMRRKRNADGELDGTSTVGFSADKAYIARFLNDGTVKMRPRHFVTRTQEATADLVLLAEYAAYKKHLKKGEH